MFKGVVVAGDQTIKVGLSTTHWILSPLSLWSGLIEHSGFRE